MSSIIVHKFAEKLINEFQFACMTDNDELWWYDINKGVWRNSAKSLIGKTTETKYGDVTSYQVKEVINKISRRNTLSRTKLGKHEGYLNVKNGMIDLETGKLLPHEPDYYSISQVPINYDPEATCPIITKFISEILSEEEASLVYELFGFILSPFHEYHNAFMLYGPTGQNGKTTLINLIKSFVGNGNFASVELQEFGENRFASAELFGKMVNIADDLSPKAVNNIGKFKQLTGESLITAEQKFRNPFQFINNAKMIFACNEIPSMKVNDEAFYRRWIILTFNKQFIGKGIDDKHLKKKLTSPSELSGLLNIAIKAHVNLNSIGTLSWDKSPEEVKRICLAGSNDNVAQFIIKHIQFNYIERTPKFAIYNDYLVFCDSKCIPAKEEESFWKSFKQYCPNIQDVNSRLNGGRQRYIHGVVISGTSGTSGTR